MLRSNHDVLDLEFFHFEIVTALTESCTDIYSISSSYAAWASFDVWCQTVLFYIYLVCK